MGIHDLLFHKRSVRWTRPEPKLLRFIACIGIALVGCNPAEESGDPPQPEELRKQARTALAPDAPSKLAPGSPTNLLLITADTTRIDRIGAYGYPGATTPYIDALAARGTRFDNAIAPVALTRPSHATMLTGLLPHSHGVWSNGPYRLEARDHPYIQRFREAGFQTAGVIASFVLSRSFGLGHGFELFDDRTQEIEGGDPEKTASEVITVASSWIQGSVRPPFLLWLHFYDPHYPFTPPEPFRSRFAEDPYDGEIAYMDQAIGDFLEELEGREWLAETLVVIVADHGEGLGERSETTHGYFLYDNTVRVPLILAGPGVPVGQVIEQQVILADLMPTFLEAFDLPSGDGQLDGRSFWSQMQSGAVEDRPAIVENRSLRNQFGWATLSGVRTNDWKWLRAPRPELFNLRLDPAETRNVFTEQQEQANRMRQLWAASRPDDRQRERSGLTPEQEEQLRSLGYLAAGPASAQLAESSVDPKSVARAIPEIEALIDVRRANRLAESAERVERILDIDPTNLFALRVMGQLLLDQGSYEQAADVLSRVVDEADAHPEAMAHLAGAYDGLGREKQAIHWYQRATSPPWIYWPALEALARIGARQRDPNFQRSVFQQLNALSATSARECLSLARAFAILGHHELARNWFARAVEVDPGLTEARVGVAQMLARLGNLELALRTLSEIEEETVESRFVKGSVLAASKRKQEACDEFRKATAMNPRNANLLLGLARQLESCGLTELAGRAYETLLADQPQHAVGLFELARLVEARGEPERARLLYLRFLEVAPENMEPQKSQALAAVGR